MDIVIGVDPDSTAHGIAIYKDGNLTELHTWALPEIIAYLRDSTADNITFSIEDVKANKGIFRSHNKNRAMGEIGRRLGMVQQSQVELERILDFIGIPYKLFKPQRGNWAKCKQQFEKVTKWQGRSNADTRSAAFMGWLAIR